MTDTYENHESTRRVSPSSPESFEAELAWNAAVRRMQVLLYAAYSSGIEDWFLTLNEELNQMDTGLTHDHETPTRKAD